MYFLKILLISQANGISNQIFAREEALPSQSALGTTCREPQFFFPPSFAEGRALFFLLEGTMALALWQFWGHMVEKAAILNPLPQLFPHFVRRNQTTEHDKEGWQTQL